MSVIRNQESPLYRWARAFVCKAITLVALGFLITVPLTWAGADNAPSGTGTPQAIRGPRVDVGAARPVVLDDIPQATPGELALHPAPLRPRDGLTDEQHRARKLQAEIISRSTANTLNNRPGPRLNQNVVTPFPFATASFAGLNQEFACPF